jgi:hypothetical protein
MRPTLIYLLVCIPLSRYADGLEARQTLKLQTKSPLFDAEMYLIVYKSLT